MVKDFLKKISEYQTEKISSAALIISAASFLSFLLGLIRDRLLASKFGVGDTLDVYYAAFRIPDFVALVLMMGAISVAIIPIFSENLLKGKEKAFAYLANFLNIALVVLVIVCGILFIAAPFLINLIAPGFTPAKKEMTVSLTRIMFLSPVLLGVSNIISAILMVFKRFLITSLSPILYNLGTIVGILFFVPFMGVQGLAFGIVFGALLHLLVQLPALFSTGFRFKKTFLLFDKDFVNTLMLTIPRAIGLTASQINFIIITAIGSTLLAGSVGIFSLANDLSAPIVGLLAIPFATAVFPALSMAFSKGESNDFLQKFTLAFKQILFLIVPASMLAFLLRAHLVRIVFGAGRFDWTATRLTAACFGIFMFAIAAQGLVYLFSKAFYARKNTIVPTLVSLASIIVLPGLAYWMVELLSYQNTFSNTVAYLLKVQGIKDLPVMGLPLAITIDAFLQIILLMVFLKKTVPQLNYRPIGTFFLKILLASLIMITVSYVVRQGFGGFLGGSTFLMMFLQTALVGMVGCISYFFVAYLLKLPEISTIKYFLNRLGGTNFNGKH